MSLEELQIALEAKQKEVISLMENANKLLDERVSILVERERVSMLGEIVYPEYTQLGVEPNINLDEDDFMYILELNGIYGNEKILLLNAFNTWLFPQQKYDILEANNLADIRTPEIVQVPLRKIVNDIKNKIERKELDADAYTHEWLKEYNRGREAIPAEINTDKYDIDTALLNYNRPDSDDGECIWSKELWAVYLTTIGNRLRPMAKTRDEFDKNYSYYMDMDYDNLDGEGY